MFDFLNFRKSVDEISGALRKIRQEIADLQLERDNLVDAPLCKSELVELVHDYVDKQAQFYPKHLAGALSHFRKRPCGKAKKQIEAQSGECVAHNLHGLRVLNPSADGAHTRDHNAPVVLSLLYIFKDQVKEGLTKAINDGWPETISLTIEQREKRIDQIDKQLEKLREQEEKFVSAASAAGMDLTGVSRTLTKAEKVSQGLISGRHRK